MKSITFYTISKKISEYLEGLLVKSLKAFLKTYTGNWFLNKLIDVAVNHLDEKIIDPIVDILIIKIAKTYDISRAQKTIDRLQKAKEERDEESYNNHLNDLLGGL